ncbi:phage tail protein [Microbulbifer litoralis]|uniref:phage tail protein n=1 Tax=Microbulbifer litoralis TaxID=2933965 RepID=UPI002028536A|nr:tail fiber protein [Microbulbifer sp. GX H0434]
MSEPFVGEIRIFAGTYAPQGWSFCNGQLLAISDHDVLFSLLGTTYGGDGRTTFALPDLRGRLPVGEGQGTGLTLRILGQKFGQDNVTLMQQQLPAHRHEFVATSAAADSNSPSGAMLASPPGDTIYVSAPDNPQPRTMNPTSVTVTGGSQPHDNIMPSLAVHYIISLWGIYPSRN